MDTDPLAALRATAQEWIGSDPDATTRDSLRQALARGDAAELDDLLGRRLQFGTAGLRGAVGPGPNRMNRLVVRRAAAGLARHLRASGVAAPARGVVVGRDARHGSAEFAADVVEVLAAHGIAVHHFDGPVPTPLAAFAVRHLGAAAGVVVTASHNPAGDNGMKVYWGDGAQIVAPVDADIAAQIDRVFADGAVLPGPDELGPPGPVHVLGGATSEDPTVLAYLDAAAAATGRPTPAPITLAVTSLHGVGAELLDRVLRAGGHDDVHAVEVQRRPDPDFPTVAFPNPEEPHALDELLGLAGRVDAQLALANDPDADRLAVAVPDRDGGWTVLSGDELGALLAWRLLATPTSPPAEDGGARPRLLATTVVSSRLVSRLAAAAGAEFRETLTGFKWLCRPALEHPEWEQVLIYEEALGYAIGAEARDKDGIVAALVAADLVAELSLQGRRVPDVLDELAETHGAHVARNGSVRLTGPGWQDRLAALVDDLVARPPETLGGLAVTGSDRPAHDVLRLWLEDDTRVVVRPSGTEPKLKYYCEAIEPVRGDVAAARAAARARLDRVVADLRALLEV